jgi:hypothetical protein
VAADHHVSTRIFGPFCRLQTPTHHQNTATAVRQALSGEVWGATANGEARPVVQAHGRALREGESGIEFYAFAPPDDRYGPRPYWGTPGEHLTIEQQDDGREVAKLRVAFVKITQDVLNAAIEVTS